MLSATIQGPRSTADTSPGESKRLLIAGGGNALRAAAQHWLTIANTQYDAITEKLPWQAAWTRYTAKGLSAWMQTSWLVFTQP